MWNFRELEPGWPDRTPHESEFFRLTEPAEAVVREFIQNSLDARISNGPENKVRIRINFNKTSKDSINSFFSGIEEHLEACDYIIPEENQTVPYIVIEDFNTTGLDGDITLGSKSNFSNFWHGEGTSTKGGRKAGRWGLGKVTFHLASTLKIFWGYTKRADDDRKLLMGKALLKPHTIGSRNYIYLGYYAQNQWDPIDDEEMITLFKTAFNISRDNEPGLSIVIPYPDDEINYLNVVQGIVEHYFYAILNGMLEIELENYDNKIELNKNNLCSIITTGELVNIDWSKHLLQAIDFVRIASSENNTESFEEIDGTLLDITENSFNNLALLKTKFNRNEMCCFRIPIVVTDNEGNESPTYFKIYLQKIPELNRAVEYYIRSGILVSDIRNLGRRPVMALLSAEDETIAKFLGDCETPAHTDWKERTEGFREKYSKAVRTLRFIKNSISDIVKILDEPPQGRIKDFLLDIFSIPIIPESVKESRKRYKKTPPTPEPEITNREPFFVVTKTSGGFNITVNQKADVRSYPVSGRVKIAYDTRRGDPFKNYEIFDFNVNKKPIRRSVKRCRIISAENNEIIFQALKSNFKFDLSGFDESRDLVLSVRKVDNEKEI